MARYMCIKTTYTDRLWEQGVVYELDKAPNKHFVNVDAMKPGDEAKAAKARASRAAKEGPSIIGPAPE